MRHNRKQYTRQYRQLYRPSVIRLAIGALALALACVGTTNGPVSSPKQRTYPVVETAAITSLGFADADLYGFSPDDVNRTLDLMRSAGVGTVRILIPWAGVQPDQNAFNWATIDTIVDAAVARNMGVLGLLNSTPAWATTPGQPAYTGSPASPSAYGDYAGAVAARYAGRISAYEVWNEPNSVLFYTPAPDPVGYTALLKAAYPKIKAAAPGATVIGGSLASIIGFFALSTDPVTFLKGMYAAGAKNYFDALSFHPYQYTTKFSAGGGLANSPINQLTAMRQVMGDNGDSGKKIWATEYGEPTSSTDEAGQADYIGDMINKWRTLPYAGPVFIYTTRDRNTGSSNTEDTFGVYRTDWTPKPAAQTIRSAAR